MVYLHTAIKRNSVLIAAANRNKSGGEKNRIICALRFYLNEILGNANLINSDRKQMSVDQDEGKVYCLDWDIGEFLRKMNGLQMWLQVYIFVKIH